jgi:lysophospholipase L1-like esterase
MKFCLGRRLALAGGASLLTAARPRVILAATPIDRLGLQWWRERHAAVLARLRAGKVDLIFLGDSITQNWERTGPPPWLDFHPIWEQFYGARNAVNLGFIGDTTANLLWRIENGEVNGIAPRAAVLLIGANNFGHVHWSAEDTVAGIDAILSALRQRLPATRVLLLSILPSDRGDWVATQTAAANRLLAARFGAPRSSIAYLDVGHLFLRDGMLDRGLYYDPRETPPQPALHPSVEGQRQIAAAIEPMLAGILGDTPRG